jgi:hypothetical protein
METDFTFGNLNGLTQEDLQDDGVRSIFLRQLWDYIVSFAETGDPNQVKYSSASSVTGNGHEARKYWPPFTSKGAAKGGHILGHVPEWEGKKAVDQAGMVFGDKDIFSMAHLRKAKCDFWDLQEFRRREYLESEVIECIEGVVACNCKDGVGDGRSSSQKYDCSSTCPQCKGTLYRHALLKEDGNRAKRKLTKDAAIAINNCKSISAFCGCGDRSTSKMRGSLKGDKALDEASAPMPADCDDSCRACAYMSFDYTAKDQLFKNVDKSLMFPHIGVKDILVSLKLEAQKAIHHHQSNQPVDKQKGA